MQRWAVPRTQQTDDYSDDYVSVDLAITFVILDTLNIFLIDWLIERISDVHTYDTSNITPLAFTQVHSDSIAEQRQMDRQTDRQLAS